MKKTYILIITSWLLLLGCVAAAPAEQVFAASCGGVETTFEYNCEGEKEDAIPSLLFTIINFMAAGVGLLVVFGLVFAGLMYSQAGGDAGKVKEAKNIILNAIIGLIMFMLLFAAVNFLVPGGLLR